MGINSENEGKRGVQHRNQHGNSGKTASLDFLMVGIIGTQSVLKVSRSFRRLINNNIDTHR
jgi:hypothetical protein